MARREHVIKLLADAKVKARKTKKLQRFIWGGTLRRQPRPIKVNHVYRVYDANDKLIGEYTSLKKLATFAFNGALSREELVTRMRYKLPYNGCRVVKEAVNAITKFYRKTIALSVSQKEALELISVHHGKTPTHMMRQVIIAFINQEVEKLPPELKQHL